MKSELDVLADISAKFAGARIPYMLTGSMAMNYYAQPRMTRDIDVVVAIHAGQIDTIIQIFGTDYYVAREAVSGSIEHESRFNLIHNESMSESGLHCAQAQRISPRGISAAESSAD